jgi:hypothetical protein
MNDDLTPLLQHLPEPEPPASIAATVMARIARDSEERTQAATSPLPRRREWTAFALALAGMTLVFLVTIKGWLLMGELPGLTTARIGAGRSSLMPVGPFMSFVWVGVVVYLAGLFAPLRSGTQR